MSHRTHFLSAALIWAAGGCISSESDLGDVAAGCREFGSGESADVDVHVQELMGAAAEIKDISLDVRAETLDACASLATDLGAEDTWSGIEDPDDAIFNDKGTGACNAASARIEEVMRSASDAGTRFGLAVNDGPCHLDFDAQAECEAGCDVEQACEPGTVETRCEPGALSVVCEGACEAGAICEGTLDRPANCMGKCESTCVGQCDGICLDQDGVVHEGDPNCQGKCASGCNGICRGECKVAAADGIQCGAEVRCKAGCTTSFSDPVCESTFGAPDCDLNVQCHAACSAEVAAHPICEPTTVDLIVENSTPEVDALVASVEANLPHVLEVARQLGDRTVDAVERLSTAADTVADDAGDLDGHSLGCAIASAEASAEATGSLSASVQGSARVSTAVSSNAL